MELHMFKKTRITLAAVFALGIGMTVTGGATANGCSACWNACMAELEACVDNPNNNAEWCYITYRSCGIGCGCEIP
jgi:hypothetical protein